MNYAAVLALVMVLSFSFPLLLNWGEQLGVSRPSGVISLLTLVLLTSVWALIRITVHRHRLALERIEKVRAAILERGTDPTAYFDRGEHLGHLLLRQGRRREALEAFDRYAQLEGAIDFERERLRAQLEGGYLPPDARSGVQRSS